MTNTGTLTDTRGHAGGGARASGQPSRRGESSTQPLPLHQPHQPRTVDAATARLASLLGAGRRGWLRLAQTRLSLTLSGMTPSTPSLPASLDAQVDGLRMQTASGVLVVSPAQPLLRVLTQIDVPESGPLQRLLLDLAVQTLPPGWMSLFGDPVLSITHGREASGHEPGMFTLSLVLSDGHMRLPLTLRGTTPALLAVLSRTGWSAVPVDPPMLSHHQRLKVPLRLGESLVTAVALRDLAPGDVVLIEQPLFDRHGQGQLRLGRRVALCELSLGNRVECRFTNWAYGSHDGPTAAPVALPPGLVSNPSPPHAMDADALKPYHLQQDADEPSPQRGEDVPPASPREDVEPADSPNTAPLLDDLPVRLSFDLGTLELRLGEIQALVPGTVLPLAAGLPAMVQVRCEGRLVATGELVEVDGRLGVELAHLGARA
ncbi:FliM/FliN family flagellar motor switch protein [Roseateles sp. SL47]|uniref:FliM/FliN family flagellar motor switch protein n=1 Tax=Roseateles sp. SL47 TaxID=2995138 RepID=UPI002271D273|nr:FliM/FliN family flagellar motor switch protein [Roseateles sp. SL47]WAC74581.1 FliM/FliN family flagellar motor switch protein [Roseateles sp. SL47]